MTKSLKFLLLSISLATFITPSYTMDNEERVNKTRERLRRKLNASTPTARQEEHRLTPSQTTLSNLGANRSFSEMINNPEDFMTKLQDMDRADQITNLKMISQMAGNMAGMLQQSSNMLLQALFPPASPYDNKITLIDKVCEASIDRKITADQSVKISELLSDTNKMASIKENFLSSLKSGLNYINSARDLMEKEIAFYNMQENDFSPEKAFGTDLLSFEHPHRKQFILSLIPPLTLNFACPVDDKPSQKAFKAMQKGGPGLVTSMLIYYIAERDFSNPEDLLNIYALIFKYIFAELEKYERHQNTLDKSLPASLHLKHRRLLSSFSDGEIDNFLKGAEILFPYIKTIQEEFEIPDYEKIFEYKDVVYEFLDKRRLEARRGAPFSRKIILALQARENNQPIIGNESKSKLEKPVVGSKKRPVTQSISKPDLEIDYQEPSRKNLKSEYRHPSEIEAHAARKLAAKEKKKDKIKNPQVLKPTLESEALEVKTPLLEKSNVIVKIGGGPHKIYQKIMEETFKGSMEKIILLIESLGGAVDDGRSGSRIHIELPHITNNSKRIYFDMLPLENDEEENETDTQHMPVIHDSLHAPHKNKSNKLRQYHVRDIRTLLINAGYKEDAVQR